MADWRGIINKSSVGGYSTRSLRDEDFEEEDVWSVMKEREDSSPSKYASGSSSAAWRLSSAPRNIPRTNINNSPTKAAVATTPQETKVIQQSSAPVNIPDWSKIYGKSSRMSSWIGDGECHDNGYYNDVNDNGDDDDNDDDMVPPHEWIAMKLARSQISSFSVCEGFGRTLKGRDLSKVRNAILTKTGFLEE